MNAGRGNVDNNDQMPLMDRGPRWNTPEDIATRYPKAVQEFADVRENVAAWFAPAGKPERHESITGTDPYYIAGGTGTGTVADFEAGKGPTWGYATTRDDNIYLHIIKGPDGKQGYSGNSLTISPVTDEVLEASWLNEGQTLEFTQNTTDQSVTIDLTGVERDPIDTIIKLVTDNTTEQFPLTDVVATGKQLTPSTLQVEAEGYRTYPALKAPFGSGDLSYSSSDTGVATVSSSGVVTAVAAGSASITVTGTFDGVSESDVLDVTVAGGKVYVADPIGALLRVSDREYYGEFSSYQSHDYTLEGRSAQGSAIGLGAATVTMKAGVVNLSGGTPAQPIAVTESDIVTFANGKVVPKPVSAKTRVAVWAEVSLDGQTFTSNRVFMDLQPYRNMADGATVTASTSLTGYTPDKVVDGKTIAGSRHDSSRWSTSGTGASWIALDLQKPAVIQNVEIHFNSSGQAYLNTPKTMEIQTSVNGTTWTTVKTVTPPVSTSTVAYFGFSDVYPVQTSARYVRLNFPQGGNQAQIDLQEVKINGLEAPVLHWTMDESTGSTAQDSSASDNDGTVAGTAAWTLGRVGNAIDLNGSNASVAAASLATTKNDNVTMSSWVKWDGATSGNQMIMYNGHSGGNGYGLLVHHSNGNKVTILLGGVAFASSQVTLPVGQWTHVAAVRRSGTWNLYVDGQSVAVTNATATTHTPTGGTTAGASPSGAEHFNGAIDEVKIFGSALTADQIASEFRAPTTFNTAPWAAATASSQTAGNEAASVADGVIAQSGTGEWVPAASDTAPSVTLTWAEARVSDKIALHDRASGSQQVTSGVLSFSDGTSISVGSLPNDGSAKIVSFPRKAFTWAKFEITGRTGTAGLSEVQVIEADPNVSTAAVVSTSSAASGAGGALVADGVVAIPGAGEWVAAGSTGVPSVTLTWPFGQRLDRIVLHDRAGTAGNVTSGTLRFSDGTTIAVPALPDNGTQHVIDFPEKAVTWASFEANTYTGQPGLSELRAYDLGNLAPTAAVTGSSMFSPDYAPAKVADGVIGVWGSGEWAVGGGDTSRWVQLTWASSRAVSSVVLYDRSNAVDHVTSGVLTFSDGSSVNVGALPNDGKGHAVTFGPKNVTWVRFQISTASPGNPGLSELQVR